MGTLAPASPADALFSPVQRGILRLLYGNPAERYYQRQILRALGAGHGAVQRELARLHQAGIITRARSGHQVYYMANQACPFYAELRGLVQKTFGLADVLKNALPQMSSRVRAAFIFGSAARGAAGAHSDVDVLIIGDVSMREAVTAFAAAQQAIGREINPAIYPFEEFCRKLSARHHFVSQAMAGPKIWLFGDSDELERLAKSGVARRARKQPAGTRRPPGRGPTRPG